MIATPASVPVGMVTFNVRNAGVLGHELLVVRSNLSAAALPLSGNAVDEAAVQVVAQRKDILSGGTASLAVDLAAGTYALLCNIPGHYQGGMHAAFTVR